MPTGQTWVRRPAQIRHRLGRRPDSISPTPGASGGDGPFQASSAPVRDFPYGRPAPATFPLPFRSPLLTLPPEAPQRSSEGFEGSYVRAPTDHTANSPPHQFTVRPEAG